MRRFGKPEDYAIIRYNGGVSLHNMDKSYLAAPSTKRAIAQDVAQLQRECTLRRVQIGPSNMTLRVQSSTTLGVAAYNRNGKQVPLNYHIVWERHGPFSFDENTRTLTANAPTEATPNGGGTGQLWARAGRRLAIDTIAVPMEQLTVDAGITFDSSDSLFHASSSAAVPAGLSVDTFEWVFSLSTDHSQDEDFLTETGSASAAPRPKEWDRLTVLAYFHGNQVAVGKWCKGGTCPEDQP